MGTPITIPVMPSAGVRELDSLPSGASLQDIFVAMLSEGTPSRYSPANPLLGLCVGGESCLAEGKMVKQFYLRKFNRQLETIWMACADIREMPRFQDQGYDFKICGPQGDARLSMSYQLAIQAFNQQARDRKNKFDHIHYNYPDPRDSANLVIMLLRSKEHLAQGGLLSLITTDFMINDLLAVAEIRDYLARRPDLEVSPMFKWKVKDSGLGTFGAFFALKNQTLYDERLINP